MNKKIKERVIALSKIPEVQAHLMAGCYNGYCHANDSGSVAEHLDFNGTLALASKNAMKLLYKDKPESDFDPDDFCVHHKDCNCPETYWLVNNLPACALLFKLVYQNTIKMAGLKINWKHYE